MNGLIHDFDKSLELGDIGEQIIYNYLKSNKNIETITPVQNDKVYQKYDIDYILNMLNGKKIYIEVKTDNKGTNNIFYETCSCIETRSLGCMEKTRADFLYYYFIDRKYLFIINMREFKKWFNINRDKFSIKQFKNKRKDGLYTSQGYTIPITYFEKEFKHFKKVEGI